MTPLTPLTRPAPPAEAIPSPAVGISAVPAAPFAPAADPVRTLLLRHHALCADAVDPLELAARLEERGVTDRTATACRHRNVFSLAEELHARAAGVEGGEILVRRGGRTDGLSGRTGGRDDSVEGPTAEAAEGADGHGRCAARPWRTGRTGRSLAGAAAWLWLLAYGLVGDRLLTALAHGRHGVGVRTLGAAAAPTALALACAVAPAAWCAHGFAGYARRRLADSRSLAAFHARTRRALLTTVAAFLGVLFLSVGIARSALPGLGHPASVPALAALALGSLLFLARLCAAHGLTRPAGAALLAACAAEALPLAALLAARLPGCAALDWPVRALPVTQLPGTHGPSVIGLVACAVPALALSVHAVTALSHAAVHGRAAGPDGAFTPVRPAAPVPPDAPAGRAHRTSLSEERET
ncbi:hypothetical protein [Streptomyces sp. I05A-00742]|uniref:hypothetical protein n=1 Tax=Streptomyces sp. I05A-00742 TaxID=2732853 RepID=UPI001BB101AD|nr:hypothetical protein [Streptomyces sp. I05A-00742]